MVTTWNRGSAEGNEKSTTPMVSRLRIDAPWVASAALARWNSMGLTPVGAIDGKVGAKGSRVICGRIMLVSGIPTELAAEETNRPPAPAAPSRSNSRRSKAYPSRKTNDLFTSQQVNRR